MLYSLHEFSSVECKTYFRMPFHRVYKQHSVWYLFSQSSVWALVLKMFASWVPWSETSLFSKAFSCCCYVCFSVWLVDSRLQFVARWGQQALGLVVCCLSMEEPPQPYQHDLVILCKPEVAHYLQLRKKDMHYNNFSLASKTSKDLLSIGWVFASFSPGWLRSVCM